jgi:hypothetical protein
MTSFTLVAKEETEKSCRHSHGWFVCFVFASRPDVHTDWSAHKISFALRMLRDVAVLRNEDAACVGSWTYCFSSAGSELEVVVSSPCSDRRRHRQEMNASDDLMVRDVGQVRLSRCVLPGSFSSLW